MICKCKIVLAIHEAIIENSIQAVEAIFLLLSLSWTLGVYNIMSPANKAPTATLIMLIEAFPAAPVKVATGDFGPVASGPDPAPEPVVSPFHET